MPIINQPTSSWQKGGRIKTETQAPIFVQAFFEVVIGFECQLQTIKPIYGLLDSVRLLELGPDTARSTKLGDLFVT